MEAQQIKAFIDAMAASDLDEMEVSHDGWTLRLVRRGTLAPITPAPTRSATPVAAARVEDSEGGEVRAPMFGVVHLHPAPGQPAFVEPGDVVEAGQVLCTIEAMKVFNELRAEHPGRVSAVLVASGVEVEAGQPLLVIERGADV